MLKVLEAFIIALQQVFDSIYLVIDGLDELDIWTRINATPDRHNAPQTLKKLSGIEGLHLLVTGREKDKICIVLGSPSIMTSEAIISDNINSYIRSGILPAQPGTGASSAEFGCCCVVVQNTELQDEVIKKLLDTHGM
jgi:hypothetical protein